MNQGPLAYARSQANTIPLAWSAKKHYRAEYTRLAKQVRDEQPDLFGDAVDVEVYKLAVLKGDAQDGARTIAQSNQVRSFQAELPTQSAHAAKLAYIQRIEQQLYQPITKIGKSHQDELSNQQVSSVEQQPSDPLAGIAQEIAVALSEAAEEQEVEDLVTATIALVQSLAQSQYSSAPTVKALAEAIEHSAVETADPASTVALQALPQSLNTLQEAERSKLLSTLTEQVQSFHNLQQEQPHEHTDRPIRSFDHRQLPGSNVRGDQTPNRAHQEPGADHTGAKRSSETIARELSNAISRAIKQQEAECLAGPVEGLNRSIKQCQFSVEGPETLRRAVERLHTSINGSPEQQRTGRIFNAIREHIELTAINSTLFAQALKDLTVELNQVQGLGTNRTVQELKKAITTHLGQNEAPHLDAVERQQPKDLVDVIASHVEEATIEGVPVVQALEAVVEELYQHQLDSDHTARAIDYLTTALSNYLERTQFPLIDQGLDLEKPEQVLNAISAGVEEIS